MDIRLRPFAEQVSHFLEEGQFRGPALWLGNTPAVLRMLGFRAIPLRMTAGVLKKIYTGKSGEREGVSHKHISRFPELIDEPVAIFASSTVAGALVVLTTATNAEGVVVVSVEANCQQGNATVNLVTSAYAKDREEWV